MFKEGHIPWNKGRYHSEETKRKISETNKGKIPSNKGVPHTEESRKKISQAKIGIIPWIAGKHHTKETKRRLSEMAKRQFENPENLRKSSDIAKELWKNEVYRGKMMMRWNDIEYKDKAVKKWMLALGKLGSSGRGLSSYEKKFIELLGKDWLFVGNGDLIIEGKCPDFVNTNGKKFLIEVYHKFLKIKRYGSIDNYQMDRNKIFSKYGYKTLFFGDEDIQRKDWREHCLKKIDVFTERIGE